MESARQESSAPEAPSEPAETDEDDSEVTPGPRPPLNLERLQKILSKAGVASRRKAEEMIEQGRVQVNGAVVTTLGTKADASRDHIRVDGKLLHGAERLRYFVLNKPKGFVTTVKDPEGRPTVMQFFDKMRERLYPVGRLDYMSEGLLLVTNDGELANKLTKAGSGVEKVYLVKVAGQPTEEELDLLRAGVSIERGKPGSPQVRTSPARIRQVRQGDNPWYEVVLIEGRNRELRKMFVAVGHFVEKIRRVGYGPLVLDQEPGNMRELDVEELAALRLAAEGKLRTPKAKDVRRRNLADAQLPTVRPKPSPRTAGKTFEGKRPFESRKPFEPRDFEKGPAGVERPGAFKARRDFGADKPFRLAQRRSESGMFGARKFGPAGSGAARPAWKKDDSVPRPPARFGPGAGGEPRPSAGKPFGDRPAGGLTYGAKTTGGARPSGPAAGRSFGNKPAGRTFAGKPFEGKSGPGKPRFGKPAWTKPGGSDHPPSNRPPFKKPAGPRRETPVRTDDFAPIKPGGLRIDPVESDRYEARGPRTFSKPPVRSGVGRPTFDRPRTGKPSFGRPGFEKRGFEKPRPEGARFEKSGPAKPRFEKPRFDKPRFDKPRPDRTASGAAWRCWAQRSRGFRQCLRPPRGESSMARPFTTSSGKPRAGGARPAGR